MLRALLLLAPTLLPAAALPVQEPAPPAPEPAPPAAELDRSKPWIAGPFERSFFAHPLYLGAEPPELRAARHVHIVHRDVPGAPVGLARTKEEARALAAELAAELHAGADFAAVARERSAARDAPRGGVMGSFAPGMLYSTIDAWLFGAELGAISEPLDTPTGWHVVQRIEVRAACRQIFVAGTGPESRAKFAAIRARLAAGEAFADVARDASEDAATAPDGGALAIFERGPEDSLLRAAAFQADVGGTVEVESPLGLHLVRRVAEDELDPALRENFWIRASGIAILQRDAPIRSPAPDRGSGTAEALATELVARIRAGEDFAALAREHNDDRQGGRERAGEIGWVHRRQPGLPNFMEPLFRAEPGTLLDPVPATIGWLVLRRDA